MANCTGVVCGVEARGIWTAQDSLAHLRPHIPPWLQLPRHAPRSSFGAMVPSYRAQLAAYFALAAAIVIWDIAAAGRIVQSRRATPIFTGATALGALLLVPALVVAVSDTSLVYGRTTEPVAWLWPVVTILFAVQALSALVRGQVNPVLGVPILVYDIVVALVASTRYLDAIGRTPASFMLVLSAAQANALGVIAGSAALSHAAWVFIPMFSPAMPSRSRWRVTIRVALATAVTVAVAIVLVQLPAAVEAIGSYERYRGDVLTARPDDFEFGLKVLPDLRSPPPPFAIVSDLQLADSLNMDAIAVVVDPEAARGRALDSLAHVIDNAREDSTTVIVTLGYSRDARAQLRKAPAAYFDRPTRRRESTHARAASDDLRSCVRALRRGCASARHTRPVVLDRFRHARCSGRAPCQPEHSSRRGGIELWYARQHAVRVGRGAAFARRYHRASR